MLALWNARTLFRRLLPLTLFVLGSASAKVIFKADFETGNLSEWTKTGTGSQNATARNIQIVTDIVQQGKYAGKFTIHEDDVFNAQQMRVQIGGPRITVEEGSDTYMSFYLYMAEPPKDRDNFFYWEGKPAAARSSSTAQGTSVATARSGKPTSPPASGTSSPCTSIGQRIKKKATRGSGSMARWCSTGS
jgi:hypothetical protein